MQGEGKDKRQDSDDDHKLDAPGNKEEGDAGYKDDKPYGSYIEVKAYYRSINADRIGSGEITYRFMLGKDVKTDYDAERNHHYKLTLKFNRFANDVDWHIDYTEEDPGMLIPSPFYISYLYNHTMLMPLKINTAGARSSRCKPRSSRTAGRPQELRRANTISRRTGPRRSPSTGSSRCARPC